MCPRPCACQPAPSRFEQLKEQASQVRERVRQYARWIHRPKQPDPIKELMVAQLRSNLREMHRATRAYLPQPDLHALTPLADPAEISQRIKEKVERGSSTPR